MRRHISALLAVLFVSSCAASAFAQGAPTSPPPPTTTAAPPAPPAPPSAPAPQGAPPGDVPAPPPGDPAGASPASGEARQHFEAGVALLQDPEGQRIEEAYREFSRAFELSKSPKVLGNMGFCAMKLERDGEAIDAYSRYLREVPDISAEERAQIVRDLQTLQVGVVRLSMQVDKPGVQIVDVRVPVKGARVTNTYGPVDSTLAIGARPGHHIVTARLPGHLDVVWEFDAYAGGKDQHAFKMVEKPKAPPPGTPLPAPAPAQRSSNTLPWIVTGVGAAMLVTGGLTGVVALGKTKDIEDKCPNDLCPAGFDLDAERSSARSLVRVTDVLLIGGAVVTGAGVTWLLLSSSGDSKSERAKSRVVPSAGCSAAGCSGSVRVTF